MARKHVRTDGSGRTTSQLAAVAEKAARALDMRRRGMSLTAIAKELGYRDHAGARYAVNTGLRSLTRAPAERYVRHELRRCELEFERLDAIFAGLVARTAKAGQSDDGTARKGKRDGAFDGNTWAADTALKVSVARLKWAEHRSRLLGLIKPPEVSVAAGALVIQVTPEVAGAFAPPEHEPPQLPAGPTDGVSH
jgi:hypothetical protein